VVLVVVVVVVVEVEVVVVVEVEVVVVVVVVVVGVVVVVVVVVVVWLIQVSKGLLNISPKEQNRQIPSRLQKQLRTSAPKMPSHSF